MMDLHPSTPLSGAAPLQIGMLLYPGMTLLDLAGPQAALGMHGRTHLFSRTLDPVMTDSGVTLALTAAALDAMGNMNEEAVEIARMRRRHERA